LNIHNELSAELKDAMRSKDRPRSNVIRQVESEVSVAKAAPGFKGEVDDALYLTVMKSYVKKISKARREYVALGERGEEQAAKLAYEIGYLSRWLPDSLDEDATRGIVRSVIDALGVEDLKMAGRVIGQVMQSGEPVDGALVSRLVHEELSG
tara:strand:+ start:9 stop:464 length:456 start_codon:yes stop_codon:yes gene_type:complete